MTDRAMTPAQRDALEHAASTDALIAFLIISHADLVEPLRIACDPVNYVLNGETFFGIVFDYRLLTDSDEVPTGRIGVPNIDRRIGQALRGASGRAEVALAVYSSADFDLTQFPRQQIGTPTPIYDYAHYQLWEVEADVAQLTGRVALADYGTEPFPFVRATQDRLPALFR